MSLIDIAKAVARNVGIEPPSSVFSSTDPDEYKLVQFSNEAGREIARRVDWSTTRKTITLDGTGANDDFALPEDFSRLTVGMAVSVAGAPVRGGVSPDEWFSLEPSEGTPRYFRLIGQAMSFYPFPAAATPVRVSYQSKYWHDGGSDVWTDNTNVGLIPEELIEKGTIWRWKRHIGADYQDYLAEFEASLADFARFDDGARLP